MFDRKLTHRRSRAANPRRRTVCIPEVATMKDVTDLVAERALADEALDDEATLRVLAGLAGEDALADLAGFTPADEVDARSEPEVEPAGAFLQCIDVRGFRGIGPQARLELTPGPGLTIVAGRNGSGKSSFSEALEVALTKQTYRWREKRSQQWQGAWRNLHRQDSRIEVELAEEEVGSSKITVDWSETTTDVKDLTVRLQRPGQKQTDPDDLGWSRPLENFRPILSYDELGALLSAEPSKLYDALARVLGLDQIADAIKTLEAHRKELARSESEVKAAKKELITALGESDQPRVAEAQKLINAKVPDLAAIRSLASGATDAVDDQLRAAADVDFPDQQQVGVATDRLEQAVAAMSVEGDQLSEALELRMTLVEAAVRFHDHQGAQQCPVCDEGMLDDDRADQLHAQLGEAAARLQSLRQVRSELSQARTSVRQLVTAPPPELHQSLGDDLEPLRADALSSWIQWVRAAEGAADDLRLAGQVRDAHRPAAAAVADLRTAVRSALDRRDDAWQQIATRLAIYADRLSDWETQRPEAVTAKKAVDWLKQADADLKTERLLPIARQVAEIWAALRQESNVEIAGIRLEGANTRRRVEISSRVDGDDSGSGLAVLSQGELHALALAMFLPRATMPDSPFRFVVLDDPVQAMDPAKVDGLVTVLAEISRRRQVIVFSHDDRLASAVRRAAVNATILEATREAGSRVTVRSSTDPARRYLSDAFALASDQKLPEETRRRILPGLLRLAVEAAARDRYFGTQLGAGATHATVEAQWHSTNRVQPRVALAIYGAQENLRGWQSKERHRATAMGVCNRGFHEGLTGDPKEICRDVERTVRDISRGAR